MRAESASATRAARGIHVGGADIAVAIVSVASDSRCSANDANYRLDTPSARSLLGQFVTLR